MEQAIETAVDKMEPTPWERRVLDFILHTFQKEGTAPTLREIMNEFGWKSTNAAHDAVSGLKKKGYLIQPRRGVARGIRLTPKALGLGETVAGVRFCPGCRSPLVEGAECPTCKQKWHIEPLPPSSALPTPLPGPRRRRRG